MLTRVVDWSSIIGALLGAGGLLFSMLAFWAANRAKRSADDARQDVRSLVAADRFHRLNSIASQLFSHIEHDNLEVASFLARDIRLEISEVIARWEFLDAASKERFQEASLLTRQVGEFVRAGIQLKAKDKTKLLRKCDEIIAILSGESGKIQSGLESRGKS